MRQSNGRRLNDNRNNGYGNSAHTLSFPLSGRIKAGTPAVARCICRLTAMAKRCCAITACLPPLQQKRPQFSFTARGWASKNVFVALFALFEFFAGIPAVLAAAYRTGLFLHLQYGCRIFMRWRSWRPRQCSGSCCAGGYVSAAQTCSAGGVHESFPSSLPPLWSRAELPPISSPGGSEP